MSDGPLDGQSAGTYSALGVQRPMEGRLHRMKLRAAIAAAAEPQSRERRTLPASSRMLQALRQEWKAGSRSKSETVAQGG